MIAFGYMLNQCGLSHEEAATFLEVTPKQIAAWCDAGSEVPWHIIRLLSNLQEQIKTVAYDVSETLLEDMSAFTYSNIEDIPNDFDGFSELPCRGAKLACVAAAILLSVTE